MENSCMFCENQRSPRHLACISDKHQTIPQKIGDIFNIHLSEEQLSKKMICTDCVKSLDTSYEFFQLVKKVQDRYVSCDISPVLIKVEVKQEYCDSLDEVCEFRDVGFSDFEDVDIKPPEFLRSSKPRSRRKNSAREKKRGNRGIRRAKEAVKITMASLYAGTELSSIFTDTQDLMQIPYEDRLSKGNVTDRVKQNFAPTAWSATQWKCPECPNEILYKNILDLNAHIHKTHKLRYRTSCPICQKQTHHFAAYLNHMIECHTPQNKFCCILCSDATFRWNLNDLYAHYKQKHRDQKVTFCLYCGLHFICGAKLKEHLIKKHKRKVDDSDKYSCDICGWVTNIRCSMKTHMIKHVTQPTFMCDQCVVSFPTSSYLGIHIRESHSNSIISCPKCEKTFRTPRRLRAHDRAVHQENNKTFICNVCSKGFHAQYRLNAHLLQHQLAYMEERYQCPHCERKFRYKPGMQYHIRSAHTGEKPYSCPIEGCFERFYDYSNAKKHITGSHGSNLKAIRD